MQLGLVGVRRLGHGVEVRRIVQVVVDVVLKVNLPPEDAVVGNPALVSTELQLKRR